LKAIKVLPGTRFPLLASIGGLDQLDNMSEILSGIYVQSTDLSSEQKRLWRIFVNEIKNSIMQSNERKKILVELTGHINSLIENYNEAKGMSQNREDQSKFTIKINLLNTIMNILEGNNTEQISIYLAKYLILKAVFTENGNIDKESTLDELTNYNLSLFSNVFQKQ